MGQKVNPIGLRLGINRTWDSRWFADGDAYGDLLLEDLKPRSPHPSGARLQQRFHQADRNGDGRIDRHECQAMPWLSRNFTSFDLDGDGALTLAELWTVQRSLAPRP